MRVERLRSAFEIEIQFRHFPLHPDTPEEGMTLEQLFAGRNFDLQAAAERMSRMMAAEGLPYGLRKMTYNSRLAQELASWAVTQPGGESIHSALFQAYFVDNINLAQPARLLEIATRIGLSETDAGRILEERLASPLVDADWNRSRQLGITGVPTFVIAGRALVGAQPYEQLESLLDSAGINRKDPGL